MPIAGAALCLAVVHRRADRGDPGGRPAGAALLVPLLVPGRGDPGPGRTSPVMAPHGLDGLHRLRPLPTPLPHRGHRARPARHAAQRMHRLSGLRAHLSHQRRRLRLAPADEAGTGGARPAPSTANPFSGGRGRRRRLGLHDRSALARPPGAGSGGRGRGDHPAAGGHARNRFSQPMHRLRRCMKACPTNTLQPAGLAAGWTALMSPQAMPRLGPCEPRCNACGHVCPTGAIRPLTADEKIWAKMGTAFILRRKCLAWEFGRPCLVCDEVCPYDAVHLGHADGQPVAVPFVDEKRCSGCGLCHHHCPVHPASAIVVEPVGALRLAAGSFRQAARRSGLTLELNRPATDSPSAARPTDGLTKGGLPPGFTP